MPKECMSQCPRIAAIVRDIRSNNRWSGPSGFHSDIFRSEGETGAEQLLRACTNTYDCPGATQKTVLVEKGGFFNRHTEEEEQFVCGLEKKGKKRK